MESLDPRLLAMVAMVVPAARLPCPAGHPAEIAQVERWAAAVRAARGLG